jgi:hypothetical protein
MTIEIKEDDVISLTHILLAAVKTFTAKKYAKRRAEAALGLSIMYPHYRVAIQSKNWRLSEKAAALGDIAGTVQEVLPDVKL